MSTATETSDAALLDLLRKGPLGIAQLAKATSVTATAVRQRISRLMGQGLVEREIARAGRGRPSHRYMLTDKGRRQTGSNFDDLALALWKEVRSIPDPEIRRGLLGRISAHLSEMYAGQVQGSTTAERMRSLQGLFADRNVPFEVEQKGSLPVITALACPYPQLAEQDRGICALERMLFSDLLGESVRLTDCRLDGGDCCRFETN